MTFIDGEILLESFDSAYDTLTALPTAIAGEVYNTSVGLRIPVDTAFMYDLTDDGIDNPELFEGVNLVSIKITEVTGVPMGFAYACDNGLCEWSGGNYGCVSLYSSSSVDPFLAGVYPLNFILEVDATYEVFGFPIALDDIVVDDLLNYYVLVIEDEQSSSIGEIIDSRIFQLIKAFPNPVTDDLTLQYGNNNEEEVDIRMHDILGNIVMSKKHQSHFGYNEIKLDASILTPGIYTLSIANNSDSFITRIIIQ